MKQRSSLGLAAAVLLALAGGCASVRVHKVGNLSKEDDGIHFYMPRPYVDVHEPFILTGKSYLVGGELTPDGQYVLITDWGADPAVRAYIHSKAGDTIAAARVSVLPPSNDTGVPAPDTGAPSGGAHPDQPATPGAKQKSGVLNLKVANDNTAIAVTPTKRYFDILWLPDFEQEYVVQGKAGLGNSAIDLKLGQGWSLQGLDASADNSELAGAVVDLIKNGMKDLYGLAAGGLGLPSALVGRSGGAQANLKTSEFAGGTKLTIRISVVKVAAPGLYPILKPGEIACLTQTNAANPPGRCLDKSVYDALRDSSNLYIPTPPLTNVAFNTYELIVVEAAKASGDSITGISRYFDKPASAARAAPSKSAGESERATELQSRLDEVVRSTNQALHVSGGAHWVLSPISRRAATEGYSLEIRAVNGSPAKSRADVKQLLAQRLAALETGVALDEIQLSFR